MSLYLDTAYVAKCYLNEPDADAVRTLVRGESGLTSSIWCRPELACVLLRHVREGALRRAQANDLQAAFDEDVAAGAWTVLPLSTAVLDEVDDRLRRLRRRDVFLRAGDAVHLATARQAGFTDVWTSDRHLLAAAPRFGLKGRSARHS